MTGHRRHLVPRVLVLSIALVAYVSGTFGLIPSPRAIVAWFGGQASERYPCEGGGCGCASALECWTQCCCHSEHDRLVWAIGNGVMPPDSIEFSDEQWVAAAEDVTPGSTRCVLCAHRIKAQVGRGVAAGRREGNCCGGNEGAARRDVSRAPRADDAPACGGGSCRQQPPARGPVPCMSAMACKGVKQLLTCAPILSLSVQDIVVVSPASAACETLVCPDTASESRGLDVPEPPPRRT